MKSIRSYAATMAAFALIVPAYLLAKPLSFDSNEAHKLAGRFKFKRTALPAEPPAQQKNVREVHPSLQRIAAWISSLGAAATLVDLDRDGLPNDLIHIDPRTDLVRIEPVPGTGFRYAAFTLDAAPLAFNAKTMAPMGTLAGDFNEDGLMDVLVYYWGRSPVIFLRKGSTNAVELSGTLFSPVELCDPAERWFSNGAIQADLDGDGHVDLIVGNYFQDGAHILDASAGGTEVLHEGKAKALNGGLKHIFLWQKAQGGTNETAPFKEITGVLSEPVNRGWTLAIGAADIDGDLLPEIYFGFDFGPDRLLHNRSKPGLLNFVVLEGKRDFTTPKSCVLGMDSFKGMGCDFGDVNGDGIPDIYVSNIATKFGLTESHFLWESTGDITMITSGRAPYVHAAERLGLARSGWGWDCKLADFDNDGIPEAIQAVGFIKGSINRWPELQALGTSNDRVVHNPKFWPTFKPGADLSGDDLDPFFVRGNDGRYHDVGPLIGLNKPMVSRGIAIADVDGDGRQDFVLANQWGDSYFFQNQAPRAGAFLGLHVLLPLGDQNNPITIRARHPRSDDKPARPAIGATAIVKLPDGRKLVSQVDGGNGHSGKRSPDLHFGLGEIPANKAVPVEIHWRDGAGRVQHSSFILPPGWHTVWLGPDPQFVAGKL